MDLSEITKVQEVITKDSTNEAAENASKEVNSMVGNGWALLKIYTTCHDEKILPNQQTLHYVLGLPYTSIQNAEAHKPFDFSFLKD